MEPPEIVPVKCYHCGAVTNERDGYASSQLTDTGQRVVVFCAKECCVEWRRDRADLVQWREKRRLGLLAEQREQGA